MEKSKKPFKEEKYEYGKVKKETDEKPLPPVEKEKPSLALSGNLAKDTNTFNGVVIKYNEPAEARKPMKRWRLYCFKGDTELPFYPMHRQSAYLIGRGFLKIKSIVQLYQMVKKLNFLLIIFPQKKNINKNTFQTKLFVI